MARPAPISPDLDDDKDEIEATPEDLAPPAREEENAPTPHAQAKSAPDMPKPGGGPDPGPAAGNITPAPPGAPLAADEEAAKASLHDSPAMGAEPRIATRQLRAAARRQYDLASILYLIALALLVAALSAAVVLVLF